ncbi:MAG: acyl--CoA ligase [Chlorobi bacterium]|nr:acyl--CoA ligase [Chlorobiota bacterium]MCI0715902.1 acyl--CoA ligase [Chlorobiota bacterium]
MELSDQTKQKIYDAHFVRGIPPNSYLVKYRNIFELLQYRAHAQPDDVYVVFYPDSGEKIHLTYAKFADKVYRTANLLKSNGIGVEDRIATVSHNHINTVIQYFAAWCLGATVVPININEEPERIKYILESSGTKLAFVKHEYLDKIISYKNDLPALKKLFVHGLNDKNTPKDIDVYENAIEKQSPNFEPDEKVYQETEALIVYTSGTTGLPKGVVLTQYNLMVDADGIAKWHKIDKGEVMMCVLPIHHVNGTIVTIVIPMYAGGRLVLAQRFHTHKFFNLLLNENVQIVSVVPTLLQFLCHDFDGRQSNVPTLTRFRHIICGAGPLTCELVSKFENMFGLKIVHGYGLSETTCYSCYIPIDLPEAEHKKWLNDYGFPSIGIAIEPNEMDIQSDKGESLSENARGEIVIRGHNVMKYYDQNPEANDKTFEFGWFRSGDEGFYINDEKGNKYFFITGRIKELIIRGGVNIAPLEIDEVLMSLPEVKAGIAVGFDNDWYGEEVGALVLLKDGQNPTDELKSVIIKKCREKLPFYKAPKAVVFSDSIPVTSTGKYQRNKVKHLFAEFKAVQFKSEK